MRKTNRLVAAVNTGRSSSCARICSYATSTANKQYLIVAARFPKQRRIYIYSTRVIVPKARLGDRASVCILFSLVCSLALVQKYVKSQTTRYALNCLQFSFACVFHALPSSSRSKAAFNVPLLARITTGILAHDHFVLYCDQNKYLSATTMFAAANKSCDHVICAKLDKLVVVRRRTTDKMVVDDFGTHTGLSATVRCPFWPLVASRR